MGDNLAILRCEKANCACDGCDPVCFFQKKKNSKTQNSFFFSKTLKDILRTVTEWFEVGCNPEGKCKLRAKGLIIILDLECERGACVRILNLKNIFFVLIACQHFFFVDSCGSSCC